MKGLSNKAANPEPTPLVGEGRRFARFIVTGSIAALVNLGSRWLLSHAMPYEAAVALAYLVGMTTAFLLARMFVFNVSGDNWFLEYGRFAAVNAFSFALVLGVSAGILRLVLPRIDWTWHAEEISHLVGVTTPIVLSYYAHKHYSFGENTRP